MKLSHNWLKKYLDFNLIPEDVSAILTDTGLEVEGQSNFENIKGGLAGMVVGKVKSCDKHPNADKLKVCSVSVDESEDLQIVCGARNVKAGIKVPVALNGSIIFAGEDSFKIKKAKLRGVESNGMICSEKELNVGDDESGIMVLNDELNVGTPLAEIFNVEQDCVYEIGLTPNRPDAYAHFGAARDLKAALQIVHGIKLPLRFPETYKLSAQSKPCPIRVEIKNKAACPRYSGLYVQNVTIGPSPSWLKNRLESIGLKSINNLVDITNFVLFELGQPLHAFDADKIEGQQIIVRNASNKEGFTTLDGVDHKLKSNDLMICDALKPLCIAGVFGGLHSGITENTKTLFLESAYFDAISIRKTSFDHLLRTNAAMHYEKGCDPNITITALERAAFLILEICGGHIEHRAVDVYPEIIGPKKVTLKRSYVNKLIGQTFSLNEIMDILDALDYEVSKIDEDQILVHIPTYRADVFREADLAEEILRIYGLNNIDEPVKLNSSIPVTEENASHSLKQKLASMLAGIGFNEVMNLSISKSGYYVDSSNQIKLLNSLNADLDSLRMSMLYGGLENISHNINRKQPNQKLFEFGKTYKLNDGSFQEQSQMAIWVSGGINKQNWRLTADKSDFSYLKGIVGEVIGQAGVEINKFEEIKDDAFAYGAVFDCNETEIARFGLVKNEILKRVDVKEAVWYAVFDWEAILEQRAMSKLRMKPIPKFPSSKRDLALLIDGSITFSTLKEAATKEGGKLLKGVDLFDIYAGKNVPEGKKSYALSFLFRNDQKTVTDKEIDKIMKRLIDVYTSKLKAELR